VIGSRAGYTLVLRLMLPFALLRLLMRARRERGYLRHLPERFGRYDSRPRGPLLWVHAVSVGETRAAQPLIERLAARHPGHRILLTHMTPTGRATGEQLYGDRVERCYLPYDFPGGVARFLDHFRPVAGVLMETEVWFNLIHACRERGIALHLVNARLSERSRRRYARMPGLACTGLNELASIAAQTASDAQRFESLGARNVLVAGNVKFDIRAPETMIALGDRWRIEWGADRPIWLAASTREGEEALILDALERIDAPGLLAVVVPRHPQRFDDVAALVERRGFALQRRSAGGAVAPQTRVLLGDSMGEMFAYYRACDVAFVGGSLLPFGSHNLLEPCSVGRPVVVGPSNFNFAEATRDAVEAGAAVRVEDVAGLASTVAALLRDPARCEAMGAAGESFMRRHQGAAERLVELIQVPAG